METLGSTSLIILISLVVYKLVLLGVGILAARLNQNEADFFLGGRGLGPWVAGLSYAASTSSAWVLLGYSGFVYAVGLSALWMTPGILGAYAVVWLVFGPRLRSAAAEHGHLTLSDFLSAKAGDWRRPVQVLAGFLVLFTFVFYIAAQFGAAAIAFESQFELARWESLGLGAGVILVYALIGGFWAVSLTDTLQGAVMALIALVLPVVALVAAGGPSGVYETLSLTMPSEYLDLMGGQGVFTFIGFALGLSAIGLGALGQPHLLSRLMAVKDETARRQGFVVAFTWGVLVHVGMAVLALSGRALILNAPDGETVFYLLADQLLPTVFAGIVIAAVLSAVMSTVDSLLIAASAAAAHDLGLARLMKGREVLISRLVMALICALAVGLTLALPASIFDRVLFSWSALGSAFGPIVLARVCGVEPQGLAVFAAIVSGFAVTVIFYTAGQIPDWGIISDLARMPGDPFERIFPWLVPLMLVFGLLQSKESIRCSHRP